MVGGSARDEESGAGQDRVVPPTLLSVDGIRDCSEALECLLYVLACPVAFESAKGSALNPETSNKQPQSVIT